MLALEVRGVERRFGRLEVLRGLDLDLEAAETIALLGPNGAGKTTLLKIVAGLLRAHAGKVLLGGRSLRSSPEVLSSLGFLTHQPYLYESLTALENIVFFARLHALPAPREQAVGALRRVGLPEHKWNSALSDLSRGLRQRVALARAIVHGPSLLLLDEPFSGLDPGSRKTLVAILAQHRDAGGSALVTTHDLVRAHAVADRIVILARGVSVWAERSSALSPQGLEAAYAAATGVPA